MIHRSPLPDIEIPDLPLTSYVLAAAATQADKQALIDGASGRALSYAGLDTAVRSLAGGLVASGFAKGDVLALMAPNVPEYAVVFHGAAMAGGVITTINPTYTETELHSQLRDSGARILVTIPSLAAVAARGCAGTEVAEIYVLGEAEGGAKPLAGLFGALVQLSFQVSIFRRFDPCGVPDVAEHLAAFHELIVQKRHAFHARARCHA